MIIAASSSPHDLNYEIKRVLRALPLGFSANEFCLLVGKTVITAMEEFTDFLIRELPSLGIYSNFFNYFVSSLFYRIF
jgi:hypothetical protein